jgi:preprotein translocase subunit SecD
LETGWVLYEKPAEGFALALPPTWKQIDMEPNTINTDLDLLEESNPEIGKLLKEEAPVMVASGTKFWSVDLDPAAAKVGSLTRIGVVKLHSEIKISLDALVSGYITLLDDQPGVIKPITHQRVELAGGDAEELRIKTAVTTTNTTTTTVMTQYILIKDQDFYSIEMGTRAEQAEKYAPIFAKIAQSFHFVARQPVIVMLAPAVSADVDSDSLQAARDILQKRLDAAPTQSAKVTIQGQNLRVELASAGDVPTVTRNASEVGGIVFFDSEVSRVEGTSVPANAQIILTNEDISKTLNTLSGISITLSPAGTQKMAEYTKAQVGHFLVIARDGIVVFSGSIQPPTLDGKVVIHIKDGLNSEISLGQLLRSGRLPFKLDVIDVIDVRP